MDSPVFLDLFQMDAAMSTNDVTLNTVQAFLGAMGTRNLDAIVELFSEQVDWFIPGDENQVPWVGKKRTFAEVQEFYQSLWSSTEALGAEIRFLGAHGDTGVVTGSFQTKILKTGKIVDSLFFLEIDFEGDLIAKYRLLEDTLQVSSTLS